MSTTSPILPCEVLDIVARYLVDDGAFATCSSLNTTSHAVRNATLKTLWTTMYWTKYHGKENQNFDRMKREWAIFARHLERDTLGTCHVVHSESIKKADHTLNHLHAAIENNPSVPDPSRRHLRKVPSPSFLTQVFEIDIAVRARPPLSVNEASELLGASVHREEVEHDAQHKPARKAPRKSTKQPFPRTVVVRNDSALNLEKEHITLLSTLVGTLLRPYATFRVKQGEATKLPSPTVFMIRLDPEVFVSSVTDFVHLCTNDPIYTTFEARLDITYAETGTSAISRDREARMTAVFNEINEQQANLHLSRSQRTELIASVKDMRNNFKNAAQTIPLALLGQFLFCDEFETICGKVEFGDSQHTRLITTFDYRSHKLVAEKDTLRNAST
ncbi:hypothetical protein QFC21_006795 [Naganishia friedmannii]|uniref:Uncharacterized protein n=1 Tax=Naganishia friedmannii TaxID=89922 RepID=A0ACC2V0N6_9TREE|nr:hypothetical protein QFC21_006795 [Naganishia friedmannii]